MPYDIIQVNDDNEKIELYNLQLNHKDQFEIQSKLNFKLNSTD